MASDMDIIRRYSRYMKHRSGCNKVQMIYMPSDRVSKLDYYTMISVADNLFFVIEIGESQVLYYWKAPVILTGLNMITNRYTDDCEYIADYDTIRNRHNKVEKMNILSKIKQKATQTGVFIRGREQTMPELFTYDDIDITAFPDTIKEACTSINMGCNELFRMEAVSSDGILSVLKIRRDGSFLDICGSETKIDTKLYVFRAFK